MIHTIRQAILHRFAQVEERVQARLEVEVSGLCAGVRARLVDSLRLEPLAIPPEIGVKELPLAVGAVRTSAWRSSAFRKIVLSEIHLRPLIEGFALTLLPELDHKRPTFACDLIVLPTKVAVHADLYGGDALGDGWTAPLSTLSETFQQLPGVTPVPDWMRGIASGRGLSAKVPLASIHEAFAALNLALGSVLTAFTSSEDPTAPEAEKAAVEAVHRRFFECFHAHGPRQGHLSMLFGKTWTDRYSRLLFE